jgi:hypothetical protein
MSQVTVFSLQQTVNKTTAGQAVVSVAPMEIRTPVLTLKGLRPGPLDDGGGNKRRDFTIPTLNGQGKPGKHFNFNGE